VKLKPARGNRDGYGAKVRLHAGGAVQYREAHSSGGYLTQSSSILHFGLGAGTAVERLEVLWPGSKEPQLIRSPRIDTLLTVQQ